MWLVQLKNRNFYLIWISLHSYLCNCTWLVLTYWPAQQLTTCCFTLPFTLARLDLWPQLTAISSILKYPANLISPCWHETIMKGFVECHVLGLPVLFIYQIRNWDQEINYSSLCNFFLTDFSIISLFLPL